jgi:hypothetical protein
MPSFQSEAFGISGPSPQAFFKVEYALQPHTEQDHSPLSPIIRKTPRDYNNYIEVFFRKVQHGLPEVRRNSSTLGSAYL